ncbi:MAG: recombinase family protein [Pseudomonadota bacterium]
MKRVALYARYSDEKQNDSSIEQQMRMLHDRAAREGWTIVAAFEDRKLTGKNTFRPGYNAMLAAAYDGKFDILLSESVDRLGRDMEGLAGIHKRFNHRGLEIVSKRSKSPTFS